MGRMLQPPCRALYSWTMSLWGGTTRQQFGGRGALKTMAKPRDGTWSINGTKIFISFGDRNLADNIVHLGLARTPDAPSGTKGISLFLVPKYRLNDARGDSNDVGTASIEHKMGLHALPTCVLSFGDSEDCIGELFRPELVAYHWPSPFVRGRPAGHPQQSRSGLSEPSGGEVARKRDEGAKAR